MREIIDISLNVQRNFDQIFRTVEWSLAEGMNIPALMLLYSTIDSAAWLGSTDLESGGKKGFEKWVNQYMVPENVLMCSALDLYGARCGILHSFSPVSGLSRGRKAKPILYAWGKGDPAKLREQIAHAKIDYLALHVNDLFQEVRSAVKVFLVRAAKMPAIARRVNSKARYVFGNMTDAEADALNEWGKTIL